MALGHYTSADYLDDIRETVVDGLRVLAVKAMYRRKVKGAIMGSSRRREVLSISSLKLPYSIPVNSTTSILKSMRKFKKSFGN